jgi:hypothetical protein
LKYHPKLALKLQNVFTNTTPKGFEAFTALYNMLAESIMTEIFIKLLYYLKTYILQKGREHSPVSTTVTLCEESDNIRRAS